MIDLKVRRIPFNFDGVDFIWNKNNPEFAITMNKLSFFAIAFEKYICQAMRDVELLITDPRILQKAKDFRAQEGLHSMVHRKHAKALIAHPRTTASLSDGGAHVASISDASFTSFMLTHWVKGRTRGNRLPLEQVIRMQTSEPAGIYSLSDRGTIAPGRKAGINIIDLEAMHLPAPYMVYDLPAGGKRIMQKVAGFRYTLVNGEVVVRDGVMTEAMPGRLVRGPQKARVTEMV